MATKGALGIEEAGTDEQFYSQPLRLHESSLSFSSFFVSAENLSPERQSLILLGSCVYSLAEVEQNMVT